VRRALERFRNILMTMANQRAKRNSDVERLKTVGVARWNAWRGETWGYMPQLEGATLAGMDLRGIDLYSAFLEHADLSEANLAGARLSGAFLSEANMQRATLDQAKLFAGRLTKTDLTRASLNRAKLSQCNFREATLVGAQLNGADLEETQFLGADLTGAKLCGANLFASNLTGSNLTDADFSGAVLVGSLLVGVTVQNARFSNNLVYGISAWDLKGIPAEQKDLLVTPPHHSVPPLTVDQLVVAQFIYLLLDNPKLREVIDTVTSKVVLILGRFTDERKRVLDALRNELRRQNLTPVLVDFSVPAHRDITETVTLLARLARFIVADLTDPASIAMELQAIAPDVAVPIASIVQKDQVPFSLFETLKKYHWVLPPYRYSDIDELLANLQSEILAPAEAKRLELKAERR
jgi:uncharacterized protein YjbI with pentapeptide repeats